MNHYTRQDPAVFGTAAGDGVRTASVAALRPGTEYADFGQRFPAFIGLARATGGWYAEKEQGMTLPDALKAGKLDFEVRFCELTSNVKLPGGVAAVTYPQRGTVAVWPDGRRAPVGLGTVKNRYQLVQNREVAELGQAIIDEGGANVVAVGAYGEPPGSKTYMAFRLPQGLTVAGRDPHDLHLTILNSHDGEGSLSALLAPIRLRCTNMTAATFGKLVNRFRLRHSGDMRFKIGEARRALEIAFGWTEAWELAAERLLDTPLAGGDLDRFLNRLLPTPPLSGMTAARNWERRRLEVRQVISEGPNNEFGRGTAYAAYNGIVEWADFHRPVRKANPLSAATRRFTRILDGEGELIKLEAARALGIGSPSWS